MSKYILRPLCCSTKMFGDIHGVFNDVRVYLCHAIDRVRTNDAEMSHVNLLLSALLNQRHASQTIMITRVQRRDTLKNKTQDVRSKQSVTGEKLIFTKLHFFICDLLDAESCRAEQTVYTTSLCSLLLIWTGHSPNAVTNLPTPSKNIIFYPQVNFKCNVP